jgi:hypothetical protein
MPFRWSNSGEKEPPSLLSPLFDAISDAEPQRPLPELLYSARRVEIQS